MHVQVHVYYTDRSRNTEVNMKVNYHLFDEEGQVWTLLLLHLLTYSTSASHILPLSLCLFSRWNTILGVLMSPAWSKREKAHLLLPFIVYVSVCYVCVWPGKGHDIHKSFLYFFMHDYMSWRHHDVVILHWMSLYMPDYKCHFHCFKLLRYAHKIKTKLHKFCYRILFFIGYVIFTCAANFPYSTFTLPIRHSDVKTLQNNNNLN